MDLVSYWVVGFSGTRRLARPDAVRCQIRDALRNLIDIADGQLVAIGSAAIGADLLFVEEAKHLKMPWIAVLPFPEDYFFNEKDFPDPSERDAARKAIARAADCEIIRIPRDRDEAAEPTWRHGAFTDAGFKCVDECDVFIAVVEEAKAGKPGGTSEIVDYARMRDRPSLIIDPETQQIRRENWRRRLDDQLTNELRQLHFVPLSAGERAGYPTPTAVTLADWRNSFAERARKHKFQVQWGNTAVVILSALAAFITALVFLLPHDSAAWINLLDQIAFVCVFSALLFLAWVRLKKPQAHGADYRFAAEIGRSLLTVWSIPDTAPRVLRSPPGKFAHFVQSLLLHYRLDPDRLRDQPAGTLSESQVNELARKYLAERVQYQLEKYYSPRYRTSQRLAMLLEGGTLILSIVAVVSAAFLLLPQGKSDHALWGLIKLTAAIAIPVAMSVLAIHEAKRREARYGEMCHVLKQYEQRISQARSLSTLQDLVVDVEHLFLSENYEWWILAKENVAA